MLHFTRSFKAYFRKEVGTEVGTEKIFNNNLLMTINSCFTIWWLKWLLYSFPFHLGLSISATVSLLPGLFFFCLSVCLSAVHKDRSLIPPLITLHFDRASMPAGQEREGGLHALRVDLMLSSSSFLFFLLCRINIWIDFDLFGSRHVVISLIWDYDENREHGDERGNSRKVEERETQKLGENKSKWLTRSQSTFRKNGWPMMSAKPVCGWQPRRSLGSCGSEGVERRVRESRRQWCKRKKVKRWARKAEKMRKERVCKKGGKREWRKHYG